MTFEDRPLDSSGEDVPWQGGEMRALRNRPADTADPNKSPCG